MKPTSTGSRRTFSPLCFSYMGVFGCRLFFLDSFTIGSYNGTNRNL